MRMKDEWRAYLERTARRLSRESGNPVRPRDVLGAMFDIAIQDEGLFDPEDPGNPVSASRREIFRTETELRTSDMDAVTLLARVLS